MEGSFWGGVAAVEMFLLFQLCGLALAWRLLPGESAGARVLLGSVCGSLMLQWFPALFAFLLGFSLPAHLLAAALALLCAGGCLWAGRHKRPGPGGAGLLEAAGAFARDRALFLVLVFSFFYVFLVLHSFRFADGRVYSCQSTYGDMSMHLSFITSLARQQVFPPEYSLLPGTRLSYPFLSDSISASLYLLGAPLRLSYAMPMWAAGAQVLFGFYLFARRLLGGSGRAAAAWALFFGNGGLGVFYFLGDGWEGFSRIFTEFYQTPTNLVGQNIRWVNVVADMMLPQRATLFGWAVLFPTLYVLYRAAFEGQRRYFLYAGVLAGALPMVHTHSFLALALVCGAWMAFSLFGALGWRDISARVGKGAVALGFPLMCLLKGLLHSRGLEDSPWLLAGAGAGLLACAALLVYLACRSARGGRARELLLPWGVLAGMACLLAFPQLLMWTFRQAGAGGFVRGHFGWVTGEDGYLWFYLKNLGLSGVLAFLGLLCCGRGRFARYAPALVIWAVAEFVEFQPNDYDNNKLLYVAFALLCCCAAEFAAGVLGKIRRAGARRALAGLGAVFLLTPAALTWGREAVAEYELYGDGALALCGYVEENLPAGAVVLTDLRHNNEVASLTGRNVVCGSPSYLFYHGLPYYDREYAAREMYERPWQSAELYRGTGAQYVLVSDFERASYQVDERALGALFPVVYDDGGRRLYKVDLGAFEGEGG